MEEIKKQLETTIAQGFNRIIISNKTNKTYEYRRIELNKVVVKGKEKYQVSRYTEKQVFQDNINIEETVSVLMDIFPDKLKQVNIFTNNKEVSFKCSKSGKLLKNSRMLTTAESRNDKSDIATHNRQKNYI